MACFLAGCCDLFRSPAEGVACNNCPTRLAIIRVDGLQGFVLSLMPGDHLANRREVVDAGHALRSQHASRMVDFQAGPVRLF
jgi:hypothetical protein